MKTVSHFSMTMNLLLKCVITGFANFVDNNRKLFSRMNAICLSLVKISKHFVAGILMLTLYSPEVKTFSSPIA